MALIVHQRRAPLSEFASVCEQCGAPAALRCGNRVCGARYCSNACVVAHWFGGGHKEVCEALAEWVPAESQPLELGDFTQEEIGGLISRLRGRDDSANEPSEGGLFSRLANRYAPKEDESPGVVKRLLGVLARGDDDGDGDIDNDNDPSGDKRLLTDVDKLRQLRSNAKTARETGKAEDLWKDTNGGKVTEVLKQMREVTRLAKDRKLDAAKPLANIKRAGSSFDLVKRFFAKVTLAGFKITFAGGKIAAGTGAETATVVGIPLDTLIDAIAIVLDVMIFAATVLEAIYGIIRSFIEIKNSLLAILSFSGGPRGVQRAVDNIFDSLEKIGQKKRAQQFIGSIIELFDRFIRWGAPIIGSVIGLAIPYDASIVGRVIEFFLYPIKFFITKGWLLLLAIWDVMPHSWQDIISDKDKLNALLVSFVDLIKRLFPVDEGETWKTRLVDKARSVSLNIAKLHPLVVVGVMPRDKLEIGADQLARFAKKGITYTDTLVTKWIDNLVIPNIDKITTTIQAALGLGFGFIYMLYAYTPEGTRKKLNISTAPAASSIDAIAAHLCESETARQVFLCDVDQRLHEIRQIMSEMPTKEGMKFLVVCTAIGVPLDPSAPNMGVPAVGASNFQLHRKLLF